MKKQLLPVMLILIFVFSVFYRISGVVNNANLYHSYLAMGDSYAEKGIVADAISAYTKALELKPDIETSLKIGNLYRVGSELYAANQWYEDNLLSNYPKDARTYEFGIGIALLSKDYSTAFDVYDEFQKRELDSPSVEEMIDTIRYQYSLEGMYEEVTPFSNVTNTAAVRYEDETTWNYIGINGNAALNGSYQTADVFSQYAAVKDEAGSLYYIDQAGEKRITPQLILEHDSDFGAVKAFKSIQSGLILAFNGEYWNYYSASDYSKRFGGYQDATAITNGVGAVCNEQQKWALINANGEKLTEFEFDGVVTDEKGILCRTNAVIVEKDGAYILLDIDGKRVSDSAYQMAYAFNDASLAAVLKNEKWIFVNQAGEEQDLGNFEDARSFSNGLAAVMKSGKWGYITLTGETVIDGSFYEAGIFNPYGCAFVKQDKQYWTMLSLLRGKVG